MKINIQLFAWIIVVMLLCYDIFCNHPHTQSGAGRDTLSFKQTLSYDTTVHSNNQTTNNIHRTDSIFMIPSGFDTAGMKEVVKQVIAEYFATYVYKNNIDDSLLKAVIIDTISRNTILGRKFTYQIMRPTAINNTAILAEDKRNKIFAGAFAVWGRNNMFGPKLTFMNKSDQQISVGKDFNSSSWLTTIDFKISLRKKK